MASVTIDIPNVGKVVAENAASEETLLKILKAVEKSEKTKREEEKKSAEVLKKSQEGLAKNNKETAAAVDELGDKAKDSASKQAEGDKIRSERLNKFTSDVSGFSASLAKSAVSLTAQFTTAYDRIAEQPVTAAAGLINTAADLAGQAVKAGTSWIPIFGKAAEAATDLAVTLAKTANDVMAREFAKTTDALKTFTQNGASFSGGMLEMRGLANQAGVGLQTLSKVANQSAADLRFLGLTQGEGVTRLASVMAKSSSIVDRSGRSLRDQMLALGYTYEEQGVIAAQYMAIQKASGQLSKMTTDEIAKGTRDYAVDLKVLRDITGQDAKAAMEKSRAEAMRGALMGKLDANQREAFAKSNTLLAKYGPEVQQALIQQLTAGTITNQAVAANADLVQMVQEVAAQVQTGSKDIIDTTTRSMGDARERIMKSGGAEILDVAALMSNGGATLATTLANINNNIVASGFTSDMAEKSRTAAVSQKDASDGLTSGFLAATDATTKFQIEMEKLATNLLPRYGKIIEFAATEALDAFKKGVEYINSKIGATSTAETVDAAKKAEIARWAEESPGTRTTTGMDFSAGSFAQGGVADGPTSGYKPTLHGTEAVVPLPGDRSIPVNINGPDTGELVTAISSAMQSQGDKLDRLIKIMEDNRNYTERLMYNMS